MMDGAAADGTRTAVSEEPSSSCLDASTAGVQEAALDLLQILLQVSMP